MTLPEIGVRKPVTTLMFFLAVLLLGSVMYTRLSIDFLPEIDNPTVTVVTTNMRTNKEVYRCDIIYNKGDVSTKNY